MREREREKSMLAVRHDDDDDDTPVFLIWYSHLLHHNKGVILD